MLIRHAEVFGVGMADVRIESGTITALGTLEPRPGEAVLNARYGALLPGLHDHHVHLPALAARKASVLCGPPEITDETGLARALSQAGTGWLRGIGFHESVTGGALPTVEMLDILVPDRPLRLQHRTGRMWFLNTCALEELLSRASPPPGLEREGEHYTGRLFDEDAWLQQALAGSFPALDDISADLARSGVTGLTDMTPRNDAISAQHFAAQRADGGLRQHLVLAGTPGLSQVEAHGWTLGPAKLHLHEAALPDFDETTAFVRTAHDLNRAVAVHCVTEVELVYAIAAFEAAGNLRGDRIEHLSIASPELVARIAALGLHACVQPHFIAEHGDRYLAEIELQHFADLYRLRSLQLAGIPLAGGSDAPYGSADPWSAMRAAVARTSPSGVAIGADEALSPEQALALYLADPLDLSRTRQIVVGEPADLCLLDRPWTEARSRLLRQDVRATLIGGVLVHQRIDEAPVERAGRTQAPA